MNSSKYALPGNALSWWNIQITIKPFMMLLPPFFASFAETPLSHTLGFVFIGLKLQ
jgi:hypothetical protein